MQIGDSPMTLFDVTGYWSVNKDTSQNDHLISKSCLSRSAQTFNSLVRGTAWYVKAVHPSSQGNSPCTPLPGAREEESENKSQAGSTIPTAAFSLGSYIHQHIYGIINIQKLHPQSTGSNPWKSSLV